MKAKILKYAIVYTLFSVGFLALCVAGGDTNPNNPMSLEKEMATRAIALCVMGGYIKAGQWCGKKGLLPDEFIKDPEED